MTKSPGKKPTDSPSSHEAHFNALFDAFLQLKNRDECRRFMQDLCTPAEILAFAERWRVARMLEEHDFSYHEIHEKTGVSITTIGRVARFLKQEPYHGYQLVMQRLKTR